jgi:hypothetical protein
MTVWAKISTPATAMACAACIATAATLPVMGAAAEKAEKLAKTAAVKLSALSDIDAFSALGAPFVGTDAFSALAVGAPFVGTDAFSALAVGAPFVGTDAFSALAVGAPFFGTDAFSALGAPLTDIAAFSAVPALLGIDPPVTAPDIPLVAPEAPEMASTTLAPAAVSANLAPQSGGGTTTPTNGANLRSAVPAAFSALVPPAPQAAPPVQGTTPAATVPDNSGADSQNIVRDSEKFTPGSTGKSPILLETANRGVDNGMPGWQSGLKKLGLGGGEQSPGGATPGMGPARG